MSCYFIYYNSQPYKNIYTHTAFASIAQVPSRDFTAVEYKAPLLSHKHINGTMVLVEKPG